MKGYRPIITLLLILLTLYIIAEVNRPKQLDWTPTLSKDDKNPYGGYVLYELLPGLFPKANIVPSREPVFNTLDPDAENSAYFLIDPSIRITKDDRDRLLDFVQRGNYAFLTDLGAKRFLPDTLRLRVSKKVTAIADSSGIRLTGDKTIFPFKPMTMDDYFQKIDSVHTAVLGTTQNDDVNFISVEFGKGKFFIHASPLVFSNAFILHRSNARYTASVLSHIPKDVDLIYWDEYYKLGREGADTPLRFLLNNQWLRWSLRIALLAVLSLLIFGSKRKQRLIPIVKPLRNTTLDFVRTVGSLYYNQRDNKNLALKKVNYFMEYVRNKFYMNVNIHDPAFAETFAAKTGEPVENVLKLTGLISFVQSAERVDDETLMQLNGSIDYYYTSFGYESFN